MKTILLLALALFVAAPQDADTAAHNAAWDAAFATKGKADYRGAAQAFENFNAQFPESPRALQALVEAGVCWFSDGRAKLDRHRVTEEARASFDRSLALFGNVTANHKESPLTSRAQYMKGSVHMFAGDLEASLAEYAAVLDTFSLDRNYVGKALERHASVQRHLLRPSGALTEMQRWVKEFGTPPDTLNAVNKQLELTVKLDKPAKPYTAELWVQGEPAPLEALGGHVVALYFFATWCPNCAKETPYVIDLDKRYGPLGLKVVGVMDRGHGQTPESIQAHLSQNKIPFTVALNDGSAARDYGASSIPFLALIDAEGRLRWCDNPGNLCDWTVEALLHGAPLESAKQ